MKDTFRLGDVVSHITTMNSPVHCEICGKESTKVGYSYKDKYEEAVRLHAECLDWLTHELAKLARIKTLVATFNSYDCTPHQRADLNLSMAKKTLDDIVKILEDNTCINTK